MVKNLASQFLSSETTIMEYDLKQAKSMNNGLLFPMLFLWFLHFKMGQLQPLLMQTASGISNLIYSPLFQVYVMGRNLERPYKTKPPGGPMQQQAEELQEGGEENNGGVEKEQGDVLVEDEDNSSDGDEDYDSSSEGDQTDDYDETEYDDMRED